MEKQEYLTVTNLVAKIAKVINLKPDLKNLVVKAEVSDLKTGSRGIYYLNLRDKKTSIPAVIYPFVSRKMKFNLENGMEVIVTGTVEVYNKLGKVQFKINRITEAGIGDLYVKLEQLKKKLSAKGYFDESIKKEIPKFPKRIGIVTSPDGAAVKDIISTVQDRWPLCEMIIFPTLVQGDRAAANIAYQIRRSQSFNLDTLIVARGGGSIKDLWAFNEETVADAIYESKVPVVTGIGHEINESLADLVADSRQVTPTAAAKRAVPDILELEKRFKNLDQKINFRLRNQLKNDRKHLDSLLKRRPIVHPESIYEDYYQYLDNLEDKLQRISKGLIKDNRMNLNELKNSRVLRNPESIYEFKRIDYERNYERLKSYSSSYLIAKENRLNRYSEAYVLKNPDLIVEGKKRQYNDILRDFDYISNTFVSIRKDDFDKVKARSAIAGERFVKEKRDDLNELKNSRPIKNPNSILEKKIIESQRYLDKILLLNPLNTLKRGYTVVRSNDKVVSSSKDLESGDDLEVEFEDGRVNTRVI
ncbi:exodeoxyribonuclease VII large subunit [uncultured Methanobrevibacter sp.]|uniref:exodeoxyribonuclease VII large subunit n=1 Tax=uncultured Methanobrevibacter sp. TaxID=253161 RepID=UPI00262ECA05